MAVTSVFSISYTLYTYHSNVSHSVRIRLIVISHDLRNAPSYPVAPYTGEYKPTYVITQKHLQAHVSCCG